MAVAKLQRSNPPPRVSRTKMHLLFDVTLTVARPWLKQPSGIDRVELAHIRHWRSQSAYEVTFVMRNAWNQLAAIPDWLGEQYLAQVDNHIAGGMPSNRAGLLARSGAIMYAHWWGIGRRLLLRRLAERRDCVFLTVSHATHSKPALLEDLRRRGSGIVLLLHDIIPLTHPELVIPKETRLHAARLRAMSTLADAGLTVSKSALDALNSYAAKNQVTLPKMAVAHLGVDVRADHDTPVAPHAGPYFLVVGTVEPRKNHALLLRIWEELASLPGCPRLVIVGRLSKLAHPSAQTLAQRSHGPKIEYLGRVNDRQLASLLKGARALLFPSLAEGFGIPLAEALASNVPAIVADTEVLREVGGDIPEYIHPTDADAWRHAILDYVAEPSARRQAQLARMPMWKKPTWDEHFRIVEDSLREVAQRPLR